MKSNSVIASVKVMFECTPIARVVVPRVEFPIVMVGKYLPENSIFICVLSLEGA